MKDLQPKAVTNRKDAKAQKNNNKKNKRTAEGCLFLTTKEQKKTKGQPTCPDLIGKAENIHAKSQWRKVYAKLNLRLSENYNI